MARDMLVQMKNDPHRFMYLTIWSSVCDTVEGILNSIGKQVVSPIRIVLVLYQRPHVDSAHVEPTAVQDC